MENQKTYKKAAILNFIAVIFFCISAILNFINENNSMGIVYLGLCVAFLCLGIDNLKKYKKSKNDK